MMTVTYWFDPRGKIAFRQNFFQIVGCLLPGFLHRIDRYQEYKGIVIHIGANRKTTNGISRFQKRASVGGFKLLT